MKKSQSREANAGNLASELEILPITVLCASTLTGNHGQCRKDQSVVFALKELSSLEGKAGMYKPPVRTKQNARQ